MGKKLYVGNLPFAATDDALRQIFTQAGTVESARVITDRDTGRSKGFGFVEMTTDAEATDAIAKFNGADYEGRPMTVAEAKPQAPREGGGGGGRGGFGGGGGGGGGRGGDRGGRGGFGGGGGGGGGRGRY
ncbi:MAG: RNA-binding protein [Deltaproteobacteria bacterium]|nr:RNA-binding protein [Deltaproteobacteria bacterium]